MSSVKSNPHSKTHVPFKASVSKPKASKVISTGKGDFLPTQADNTIPGQTIGSRRSSGTGGWSK